MNLIDVLVAVADGAALTIECIAVLFTVLGVGASVFHSVEYGFSRKAHPTWRKDVWVELGIWLLLALQFALAADIVRSVISPTWKDIGHLAAIAVIRTFLGHFLEKDMIEAEEAGARSAGGASP